MQKTDDTSKFYSFTPLLSRNGVFNMVVGGRGIGKSYGAKKMVVAEALKSKWQFIYLRRWHEELKTSASTFFADIAQEFPGYEFKVEGSKAYARKEGAKEWRHIGYFLALSKAQSMKSTAYPNVKTIIFDEFIADDGKVGRKYISNTDEWSMLLNFYNTVDRLNDRVRVIMLANSTSIMNPYFLALDIMPDGREWVKAGRPGDRGYIIVHFPEMTDFNNAARNTRFGKFISGSDYEAYAIDNKFMDANGRLVERKTPKSRYMFTLLTKKGNFSIWLDMDGGWLYAQTKRPKDEITYTNDLSKVDTDVQYMSFRDKQLDFVRRKFHRGEMAFDKPTTRNAFLEIFK